MLLRFADVDDHIEDTDVADRGMDVFRVPVNHVGSKRCGFSSVGGQRRTEEVVYDSDVVYLGEPQEPIAKLIR